MSAWRRSALAALAAVIVVGPVLVLAGPAIADPIADVRINEVESNGGTPGDWVELINKGAADAAIGGWVVKDNDDTHIYTIPAGSIVTAGGYYVVDTDLASHPGNFGLGAADSARLFTPNAAMLVDAYSWTAHATVTYGRCPNGSGTFVDTVASTKGAANTCPSTSPNVKINEIESSDGTNPDWIELINNGAAATSIGGWVVKDNDDSHALTIPSGTMLAAGGNYVINTDDPGVAGNFGLGSADSARLFMAGASTLVDSYAWAQHATVTYGRCPNGTGGFVDTQAATKGTVNNCPGDPLPWPGGPGVATADGLNVLGGNMSGLTYQPSGTAAPGVLWAVKNGPGTLFRLLYDGTIWAPDTANGWANGKVLRYPDGTGDPDAEGVTLVGGDPANGVYVSTERNNSNNSISRPAVLRFDVSGTATSLNATNDWNLTSDLPVLGANLGLEAVQWMSDGFLVSKGFKDEATNAPYNPATYPNHGAGLFLVGVEQNGNIYAYALRAEGTFARVATISTGFPAGVMELSYEPETTHLWAVCDDTCGGRHETFDIASSGPNTGKFVITNVYARPAGMPNFNNEGFTITPREECLNGLKPVFWADDTNDGQHALRAGTINCTPKANPTLATQASPGNLLGGPVRDVGSLTGGSGPTGTVAFALFSDNMCTTQVFTSTNTVSAGSATSDWFTPAVAGTYWWTAAYSGDANNNPATSACLAANESVVIAPFNAPPFTTTITGDLFGPVTVNAGQSVLIDAARVVGPVTVNPGGTLTITNSQISGGITANAPGLLSMCGSQVSGSASAQALDVSNAVVPVRIGDPATGCAGNRFVGLVNLTSNMAVTFGANIVSNDVNVIANGPGNTIVKANTLLGASVLACSANNPAPTSRGQANTAPSKSGQCAAL